MRLNSKSLVKFSAIAVSATTLTIALAASAAVRRLTPAGYCQAAGNGDNSEASSVGYFISHGPSYIVCGIPNDSILQTSDITQVNVHIRTSSSSAYAQPCVYKYDNPSTFECDNYKSAGGTGERQITFLASNGDLDSFTSHATWGSAVYVRLLEDGDLLNLVYVKN